jgi:hypothetical protein
LYYWVERIRGQAEASRDERAAPLFRPSTSPRRFSETPEYTAKARAVEKQRVALAGANTGEGVADEVEVGMAKGDLLLL